MTIFTDYIKDCELQDTKMFTQTLKTFQRIFNKYPRFEPKDAKYLFDSCSKLFQTSQNPVIQANAIKLAKFATTSTRFMRSHAHEIWQLYKETVFHENELVRKAGVQFVARYYFGVVVNIDPHPALKIKVPKEKQKELKKFLMFNYLHLMYLEKKYMTERSMWPTEEEVYENPGIFLAMNTKDVFLKNIRRGIESFGTGKYMIEIMTENGYAHSGYT